MKLSGTQASVFDPKTGNGLMLHRSGSGHLVASARHNDEWVTLEVTKKWLFWLLVCRPIKQKLLLLLSLIFIRNKT